MSLKWFNLLFRSTSWPPPPTWCPAPASPSWRSGSWPRSASASSHCWSEIHLCNSQRSDVTNVPCLAGLPGWWRWSCTRRRVAWTRREWTGSACLSSSSSTSCSLLFTPRQSRELWQCVQSQNKHYVLLKLKLKLNRILANNVNMSANFHIVYCLPLLKLITFQRNKTQVAKIKQWLVCCNSSRATTNTS